MGVAFSSARYRSIRTVSHSYHMPPLFKISHSPVPSCTTRLLPSSRLYITRRGDGISIPSLYNRSLISFRITRAPYHWYTGVVSAMTRMTKYDVSKDCTPWLTDLELITSYL